MDSQQTARIRELFDAASELPASDRAAYLNQQCDDPAIRERVQALLSSHDSAADFLSIPAADLTSLHTLVAESRGDASGPDPLIGFVLGQYRIASVLGKGGMGIVYRAEQRATQRPVAIKVVRSLHGDSSLLRRFQQESLVLGRLKHPGIAQIYEAGAAPGPDGREVPFFAMELVAGRPLLAYSKPLGVRERLELFARICDAVSHAHQKGVIHRDLKPGNILIEEGDLSTTGTASGSTVIGAQPKILDFGVARLVDPDAANMTMQTAVGQVIGTLAYMSPEQIRGDTDKLDTRSDIYSLGVILCELLTGELPYTIRGKTIAQAARIIGEEDPTIHTGTTRALRGDIETIIQKALAKEPERRYQSAAELAADIRRYLGNLPIVARPATATYQLRKFASRNKALVGGVMATIAVLVLGVVGTSIGLVKARAAQKLAEKRETEAHIAARTAEHTTEFVTAMFESVDPENGGGIDTRVITVLDDASADLHTRLADEPLVEIQARRTLGSSYLHLGAFDRAEEILNPALASARQMYPDGSIQETQLLQRLAELALERREKTKAVDLARQVLAQTLRLQSGNSAAIARAHVLLGTTCSVAEQVPEACSEFRAANAIYESDATLDPNGHVSSMIMLAGVLSNSGEENAAVKALETYKRAIELEKSLKVPPAARAQTLHNYANFLFRQRKLPEAEAAYRECISIREASLPKNHPKTLASRYLLGQVLATKGEASQAEALYVEVRAAYQAAGIKNRDSIRVITSLADIRRRGNRLEEAEALAREAVELARPIDRAQTATALRTLANVLVSSKRPRDAVPIYEECAQIRSEIGPTAFETGLLLSDFAQVLLLCDRFADALARAQEATVILDKTSPTSDTCGKAHFRAGQALMALNRAAEAENPLRKAYELLKSDKQASMFREKLAENLDVLGKAEEAAKLRQPAAK